VYNELDLNYVFFQWLFVMIYLPIENQQNNLCVIQHWNLLENYIIT